MARRPLIEGRLLLLLLIASSLLAYLAGSTLAAASSQARGAVTCYDWDQDDYGNEVDVQSNIRGPSPQYTHGQGWVAGFAGCWGCPSLDPFTTVLRWEIRSQYLRYDHTDIIDICHNVTHIENFGVGWTGLFVGSSGELCLSDAHSATAVAWYSGYCSYCGSP
ncbi:MAG: hypothetical protein LRS49_05960 [Desulfurococcales archaeon]|nr:hypothetical protein [Desulfurococcales archaeon]